MTFSMVSIFCLYAKKKIKGQISSSIPKVSIYINSDEIYRRRYTRYK